MNSNTQSDTHAEARASLKKLLAKELAPKVSAQEESGEFDHALFRKMGAMGFAAPMLPSPYGMDDLTLQCLLAEEMGYVSSGFGLSALASIALFGANVARQGTEEQKKKYLPGIATGEKIGCWGLTEPEAGSDALSIKSRCLREGDSYVVNGTKTFITNAPIADYFIVIARECSADGKPVEGFQGGTAFILERGMAGLTTGKPFHKLGHQNSPTGEIFMENVRVPAAQVLGKPGQAFLGMKVSLDVERAIFGGIGMGLTEFCLHSIIRYGAQRKQFGVSILEHQMIQDKIARISASYEMTRTYMYKVIDMLNRGQGANKEAAILKLTGSQAAFDAASDAVQCLGGYGYMREYQVERCLRDAKLYVIGGGTSEIQKLIIAKATIKEVITAS